MFQHINLEENIDINSATGKLVFHVFGAIAQFEHRVISERKKDRLRAARTRGRTDGRPAVNTQRAREFRAVLAQGTSVTQAARYVGTGRSTADCVLRATLYQKSP